jgi:hypothetical protein
MGSKKYSLKKGIKKRGAIATSQLHRVSLPDRLIVSNSPRHIIYNYIYTNNMGILLLLSQFCLKNGIIYVDRDNILKCLILNISTEQNLTL